MARKSRRGTDVTNIQTMSKIYKTAIYARLSTEDFGRKNNDTIENQIQISKDFISGNSLLELVQIFSDNGETGTNFDRPAFLEMMEAVKSKKIDCIVVKDLSRFGRNYIETGNYLEKIFPFMGVRFISVNDNFDSSNSNNTFDNLSVALKSLMHDVYAKDISKKVSSSLEIKQKNGDFIGCYAAYGYLKSPENNNKLVVDEVAGKVVRDIFNWKLQGMSNFKIAKKLNDLGVLSPASYRFERGTINAKTPPNNLWQQQTIKSILKNPVYIGYVSQGKHKRSLSQGISPKRTNPEEWINVLGTHTTLVDRVTFEKVSEILKKETEKYNSTLGKYEHLGDRENIFKGVLVCSDCGSKLIRRKEVQGRFKTKSVRYVYICQNYETHFERACASRKYIDEREVKAAVWESVKTQIELCLDMAKLITNIQKSAKNKSKISITEQDILSVNKKISRLNNLLSSLYDDYLDGILTEDEYLFAKDKYKKEKVVLEQRCNELLQVREAMNSTFAKDNALVNVALSLKEIETVSKDVLLDLVDKITVFRGNSIEIIFKYRDEYKQLQSFINKTQNQR